jgi:hypothetical protein
MFPFLRLFLPLHGFSGIVLFRVVEITKLYLSIAITLLGLTF